MHYLSSAPLARNWVCAQTVGRETVERVDNLLVACAIFFDQISSFPRSHVLRVLFPLTNCPCNNRSISNFQDHWLPPQVLSDQRFELEWLCMLNKPFLIRLKASLLSFVIIFSLV